MSRGFPCVLIADDDPEDIDMLAVELRRRFPQIKIESVGNGLDALAYLISHAITESGRMSGNISLRWDKISDIFACVWYKVPVCAIVLLMKIFSGELFFDERLLSMGRYFASGCFFYTKNKKMYN